MVTREDLAALSTPTDPDSGESIVRRLVGRTERRGEDESISTPCDKTPNGLPRHVSSRSRDFGADMGARGAAGPRRPAVWNTSRVVDATPTPVYGAFPKRFVAWALRQLGASPREVLHVCSGMLTRDDVGGGVRVDV